jgi:hypothetical protein
LSVKGPKKNKAEKMVETAIIGKRDISIIDFETISMRFYIKNPKHENRQRDACMGFYSTMKLLAWLV